MDFFKSRSSILLILSLCNFIGINYNRNFTNITFRFIKRLVCLSQSLKRVKFQLIGGIVLQASFTFHILAFITSKKTSHSYHDSFIGPCDTQNIYMYVTFRFPLSPSHFSLSKYGTRIGTVRAENITYFR